MYQLFTCNLKSPPPPHITSKQLSLEVEEVPFVRSRLQGWRETLHTPLVLDLVFEASGAAGAYRVRYVAW